MCSSKSQKSQSKSYLVTIKGRFRWLQPLFHHCLKLSLTSFTHFRWRHKATIRLRWMKITTARAPFLRQGREVEWLRSTSQLMATAQWESATALWPTKERLSKRNSLRPWESRTQLYLRSLSSPRMSCLISNAWIKNVKWAPFSEEHRQATIT